MLQVCFRIGAGFLFAIGHQNNTAMQILLHNCREVHGTRQCHGGLSGGPLIPCPVGVDRELLLICGVVEQCFVHIKNHAPAAIRKTCGPHPKLLQGKPPGLFVDGTLLRRVAIPVNGACHLRARIGQRLAACNQQPGEHENQRAHDISIHKNYEVKYFMPAQLQIDFVSDVACPWCAIGLGSLEEALRRTAGTVTADIHFQPFELNPGMRPEGENIDEFLGGRYGAGSAQMAAMRENVRDRAAGVGVVFNQNAASRIYNTFDAHRLLHWARHSGKQTALKHALFKANFSDNSNVSDHDVLITASVAAGLDAEAAREVLTTGRYTEEVRQAEKLWISRGIQAVPGIVINGKWLISGGQPPDMFEQTLRKIAAEIAAA
jgi:predicted DsbA family dithiol-disulfide isomerase